MLPEALLQFIAQLPSMRGRDLAAARWEFDSVDLLQIVTFLEESFGLDLSETDIDPEEFRSAAGLAAILDRTRRP
jgi:acyl carrier protein